MMQPQKASEVSPSPINYDSIKEELDRLKQRLLVNSREIQITRKLIELKAAEENSGPQDGR